MRVRARARGEAKYWKAYDNAKQAALRMAARLSAHEKAIAVQRVRWDMINEARLNATPQGRLDTGCLSIDHPDEDGNLYDYGDCSRAARRMFRELDAEYREKVIEPYRQHKRDLAFWRAFHALKDHPELQATLRAKRRYRVREKNYFSLENKG